MELNLDYIWNFTNSYKTLYMNHNSDSSIKFFDIIYDICREAKITSKVAIVPAAVYQAKQHAISTGKIIPGIASLPISKQLDDSLK